MELIPNSVNKKEFYDHHLNFSARTLIDYYISPGTKAKFNLIKKQLGDRSFQNALDIGCSGNSILPFLPHIKRRFYFDIARSPLTQFLQPKGNFPVIGMLEQLPFLDETFDFIAALDVIEHIFHDSIAAAEISRILKPGGILLVSVPHSMKYFTYQDSIIGHYRRYEVDQLKNLFLSHSLKFLRLFGIYGQAMRVQLFQAAKPSETEQSILKLRNKYLSNAVFRKIWDKFVDFGKFWMTIDAKYQPLAKKMNIGFIFKKNTYSNQDISSKELT
ncbi:MAG: methyltransferase domain-containing protein [Promethearchaeota archaeon]